jgi:phosphoglycerate dehydrogenase-like enzyme
LLNEGKWDKAKFANCVGLKGRTLGLIGFGAIGQLVLERAKAFDMNVLVYSRTKKAGLDKQLDF